MTLNDLIPGRRAPKPRKANRTEVKLARTKEQLAAVQQDIAKLLNWQAGADDFFAVLMQDVVQANAGMQRTELLRQEAEQAAAQMRMDRDEWRDEALALRARFGPQIAAEINDNRVDVPCGYRDTSAIEDQATGPIYVQPLWDALGGGPTAAVTDPGQVPQLARKDDTVPVPVVRDEPAV